MTTTPNTVFVVVSDAPYFSKAKRTLEDLRLRGEWKGDVVFLAIGFYPSQTWADYMNVRVRLLPPIDVSGLQTAWSQHPLKPMDDQRHIKKLAQWNKLYVFDTWFCQWDRVIFLDAGMRVLHTVSPLLELDWRNAFLAPDDTEPGDNGRRFGCQLDLNANPPVTQKLESVFGTDIYQHKYFMNCIWIYDTSLLCKCNLSHLQQGMNEFPICMTNEMALLNLYFTFLHKAWKPFPEKTAEGKYLYGWSELNYPNGSTWRDFHFLKYPVTISINCE